MSSIAFSGNRSSAPRSAEMDRCVEAFQDALNRGQRPPLNAFLPAESAAVVLVELVHVELEFRLKQGEAAQVEEYLARYPQLADDPAVVAELALAEYTFRRRGDRALDWESYVRRFPACRDEWAGRLLHVNALSRLSRGIPLPDAASDNGEATVAAGAPVPGDATVDFPHLPGYEILSELGRGGMGVIWKARHLTLNRTVALKMLHAERRSDEAQRARFRVEVEAIALLQHPNIVQVYDIGEHEGCPFFAMEFLDGGSLTEHCRGEPQAPKTAAAQVETLARAMHAVHAKGIIHRDLKPSNVMRTADGSLKITDFGLARREASDLTTSGDVLGTPSYMAPEQAAGKVHEIGPATDGYALGAILYELLTGRPPFRGVTLLDTLRQVQDIDPVSPRQMQPRTPRDLETICLKCLHKEPRKRYVSALDLAEDLRLFLAGESVHARRPAWPERAVRWSRRRPAIAVLLAAISLLALAVPLALLGHTMQLQDALDREQQERDNARRAEHVAQLHEAEARVSNFAADLHLAHNLFKAGDVFQLPGLLDPQRRENGADNDPRGFAWWYLRRQSQVARSGLEAYGGPLGLLRYSPDGRSLITSGGEYRAKQVLKVWDRTNWRLRFSWPLHTNSSATGEAYAPDGGLLAGVTESAVVTLWDAKSGERRRRLPLDEHAYNIALSPDGRRLVVNGTTTSVWDCATGRKESTLPIPGPWGAHLAFAPDGKTLVAQAIYPSFHGLQWWDSVSGRSLERADAASNVWSLAFSPRGTFLLFLYPGGGAIWSAAQRIPLHWSHTIGPCNSLAVSPDERTLAVGAPDGQVHLRDIATGRFRGRYRWQSNPIVQVAFSPDNRTLAAATMEGQVREMDATVEHFPDQLQTFAVKGRPCWSPDGETLAIPALGATVRLLDRRTGEQRLILRCPAGEVRCLAFAPDGRILATSCHGERIVRLWDTKDGRLLTTTAPELAEVSALAFSSDGRRLASVFGKLVRFFDPATGSAQDTLEAGQPIQDLAFPPDGRSLLTAGPTLDVWDLSDKGGLPRKPTSSGVGNSTVLRLAITRDGRRVATGQDDGIVRVWRFSAERKLTFDGPELSIAREGAVTGLDFGPDHQTLLVVSPRMARLCDVSTRGRRQDILSGSLSLGGSALSPDGRTLALVDDSESVRFWDLASWRVRQPSGQALSRVTSLLFSTDGRRLVTAGHVPYVRVQNRQLIAAETAPLRSTAESLRFWDAATGRESPPAVPGRETMTVPYVAARSPDGRLIAAGAEDGSVQIWDWSKGQWLTRLFVSEKARLYTETSELARRAWTNSSPDFTLNGESIRCLAFSADGRGLTASGNRGSIRVWDTDGWKARGQWRGTPDGSPWVAFTPDSESVVGSRGGQVCIWDARSGEERATLGAETESPILCGVFAPGKDVLALGSKDGALRLWDIHGGVKRLPGGHQDRVTSLAFAPDGKTLASASWDRTVRLWNMAAHREVATLEGHKGRVNVVAFSPDGMVLASGGEIGEVLFRRR